MPEVPFEVVQEAPQVHDPVDGHGANSQFGPVRPTLEPSGQGLTSLVHPFPPPEGQGLKAQPFAESRPTNEPSGQVLTS